METWGQVLRSVREARGLSLQAFANRARYGKTFVGYVETGERAPNLDFARACDETLGTSPLLVMMLGTDERDDVKRRALLGAASLATVAGTLGIIPLGHLVRDGFWEDAVAGLDHDATVAKFARQFVVNATEEFGQSLMAQLLVLQQKMKTDPSPDLLRAAARLAELYGLWLGNQQYFADASNWYSTAAMLASRSGDQALESYIQARTANRRMFEGAMINEVRDGIDKALALNKQPTAGRVEAHAARVCLGALTGNVNEGRRAMADMLNESEQVDGAGTVAHVRERVVFHQAYLDSRVGTLRDAERACEEAFKQLTGLPYWLLEARLYLARAMVVHGNVQGGIAEAVGALNGGVDAIGVIKVAARDVVHAVPQGVKSDELAELKAHASTVPGPWETL